MTKETTASSQKHVRSSMSARIETVESFAEPVTVMTFALTLFPLSARGILVHHTSAMAVMRRSVAQLIDTSIEP